MKFLNLLFDYCKVFGMLTCKTSPPSPSKYLQFEMSYLFFSCFHLFMSFRLSSVFFWWGSLFCNIPTLKVGYLNVTFLLYQSSWVQLKLLVGAIIKGSSKGESICALTWSECVAAKLFIKQSLSWCSSWSNIQAVRPLMCLCNLVLYLYCIIFWYTVTFSLSCRLALIFYFPWSLSWICTFQVIQNIITSGCLHEMFLFSVMSMKMSCLFLQA